MAELIVRLADRPRDGACALCGISFVQGPGPHLCLAAGLQPVCQDCGRTVAPALAALLELASVALTVGRASRHRPLWAPQELLLALTLASETYAALVESGRQGG